MVRGAKAQQGQRTARSQDSDLKNGRLPERPAPAMTLLLDLYERFVKSYPDRAKVLLARCEELTEKYRLPDTERNLSTKEAARRIGISRVRVFELYQMGRLGACIENRLRFSEAECDDYRDGNRQPGRRPLNRKAPS